MLPFVRTPRELAACRALVEAAGLLGRRGFELWIMAEVPSVLFHLRRYAELGIDGISIGSNDLTQLMLGADRDSELVAETFDERDPAVVAYLVAAHRPGPRPRARDVDLRTGAVRASRVRRAARAGGDRRDLRQPGRRRRATRRLIAAAERRVLLDAARLGRNPLATSRP